MYEKLCICGCGEEANYGQWKRSHWLKGNSFGSLSKGKPKESLRGRKLSLETREKISAAVSGDRNWNTGRNGEDHPAWRGGLTRPELKMKRRMRKFIERMLLQLGTPKEGHTEKQLGYSAIELKKHLETQFQDGMSWENYGKGDGKWHIDHIQHLNSFPMGSDPAVVNSLSNLRPLWEWQNLRRPWKAKK